MNQNETVISTQGLSKTFGIGRKKVEAVGGLPKELLPQDWIIVISVSKMQVEQSR